MDKVKNFICQGDNLEEIPESLVIETGLKFPDAHKNSNDMSLLARVMKKYKNDTICRIPFCVTVEAEALGANIKLGDMKCGPRVDTYAFSSMEELENIKEIDLECKRIREVLDSVEALKSSGELVALCVEGPFTIISSLIDPMVFYKGMRKNKDAVEKVLKVMENSIVKYILEGIKRGAGIISYGDPVGAPEIVGPKIYKDFSGKASLGILKRVEPYLGDAVVHLCGKTSTAFETMGFCEVEEIIIENEQLNSESDSKLTYGQALNIAIDKRKDIKFLGHSCIKGTPIKLSKPVIWKINIY